MSEHTCDCGGSTDGRSAATDDATASASGHWLDERPVTEARLPADAARALGRTFGGPSKTLGEWAEAIREATGGGAIEIEDLCRVDGETAHRATVAGETYHFQCFYDGIALARLEEEPVEIRTVSPSGEVVEVRTDASGDVPVDPPDAAMSFGIADGREAAADDRPIRERIYATVCPYVRAFAGREAYLRWAERVDATTVGVPLTRGVAVAAALTE